MNNRKHYLAAVVAFFIWGFFPLPLKALSAYTSGEILYFRILFSLATLGIVVLGFKRSDLQSEWMKFKTLSTVDQRATMALTFGGAILLTINWLTFIYVVNHVNVKSASFAYLICPVITAVLGFVLIRERISTLQWIAVALCAFSCVLVGISSLRDLGFSVFTAFTYALYLITQRKNQGFDRMIILGIQVLFSFLIMTCGVGILVETTPVEPKFYILITVIAVFFTVLPLFLNLFALNRINSATIGILMYLNPLINFSIAFLIYNEQANALQMVGYGIILVGLIVFNYPNFIKLKVPHPRSLSSREG
jgi:chloramphenicol-sensitive protein RarD